MNDSSIFVVIVVMVIIMSGILLVNAFQVWHANRVLVSETWQRFGIRITTQHAEYLNDHRIRDRNTLDLSGRQQLVKVRNQPVLLRQAVR